LLDHVVFYGPSFYGPLLEVPADWGAV